MGLMLGVSSARGRRHSSRTSLLSLGRDGPFARGFLLLRPPTLVEDYVYFYSAFCCCLWASGRSFSPASLPLSACARVLPGRFSSSPPSSSHAVYGFGLGLVSLSSSARIFDNQRVLIGHVSLSLYCH
ncbi:hypothetical protein O3P69_013329 [Scylla paramamosain]|uniref:Uncharacterized protein n=1 Tax=Scylla paramamosain TaxID=85552 RepID=A0AAW0U300_SCYPA